MARESGAGRPIPGHPSPAQLVRPGRVARRRRRGAAHANTPVAAPADITSDQGVLVATRPRLIQGRIPMLWRLTARRFTVFSLLALVLAPGALLAQGAGATFGERTWASAEYLLWWIK